MRCDVILKLVRSIGVTCERSTPKNKKPLAHKMIHASNQRNE